MSLRGYSRTESVRIDWIPAIRITRLTTIARTGRRMKRSVNFMGAFLGPASAVDRVGRGVVAGLRLVVDLHRRAIAQLEHARRHDFLAGFEPREDGDLIAAPRPHFDELLANALVRLALLVLHLLDDVDGVAVGSVIDRGRGNRDEVLDVPEDHARIDEHSRPQLPVRVRQRRLDRDV